MEKVKLTKEQAIAIESLTSKKYIDVKFHLTNKWTAPIFKPLNELSGDDFIKALYVGYEVEPEYNPGDYVVNHRGTIGRIDRIEDNMYHGIWFNGAKDPSMWCEKSNFRRHATQKEIEEANKEIEWWKKHNKNVWELRHGDIIKPLTAKTEFDFCEVKRVTNDNVFLSKDIYVTLDDLKKYWEVVCFKEDRQDV